MVVSALPPEKQADVAKRIAQMDRTSPDVIKQVEKVLERKLSSLVNQDYTIVGGVDSAATYAEQIVSIEAYRPEKRFADAVKGLHVYGAKVVDKAQLACLKATFA